MIDPRRPFAWLLAAALLAPAAFGQDFAQDEAPADAPPADPAAGENGGAEPADADPADAADDADDADDEGPKTGPPLPADFVPPPEKPEAFTAVTPLMTADEHGAAARALDRARYGDVLDRGPKDGTEEQLVRDWAAWRVAGLTVPATFEDRPLLKEAVDELLREANRDVGSALRGRDAERVRQETFAVLADELAKLKDNHLVLRIVAARILGELRVEDGRNVVRRYGPAVVPLLELFETAGEDPSSLVDPEYAAKLAAARALGKVARTGADVPGQVEQRAAEAFTAWLVGHPGDPGWFQAGLADAVRETGLRLPALSRQLLTVMQDGGRPCEARAAAAMAVVRLPGVPAEVRTDLPAALEALGKDVAESYNAAPGPEFVHCVRRLAFAFKPMGRGELDAIPPGALLTGPDVPGFLNSAYNKVRPVVAHVAAQDLEAAPSEWPPVPADILAAFGG